MNTALRTINTLLLAGLLWVATDIRAHMPPTLSDFKNAKDKRAFLLRRPFFNTVEIDNASLAVEIENTPVPVQIER